MQEERLLSEKLRGKIRAIFNFVRDTVMSGNEPNFEVVNMERMLQENDRFDANGHCLVLQRSETCLQMRKIHLVSNSFTFHKIMKMLDYLDCQLANQQQIKVRKRAVYYSLVSQGFSSTDMVDEYLAYAC